MLRGCVERVCGIKCVESVCAIRCVDVSIERVCIYCMRGGGGGEGYIIYSILLVSTHRVRVEGTARTRKRRRGGRPWKAS